MAPFQPGSEHNGARNLLRAVIILTLVLAGVTLWTVKAFNDAMAKSQLNLVQGQSTLRADVADVKKDVGNIKDNVHEELASFTRKGNERIQTNSENTALSMIFSMAAQSAAEEALKESKKMHADLLSQMKVVKEQSSVATEATLATHAKVSQKIVTGADAEAVRRKDALADRKLKQAEKIRQAKHPAVVKFWPWQ